MIAVVVELRELHERLPAKPGRVDSKLGDKVLLSSMNSLEVGVVIETEKMVDKKEIEFEIVRHLNDDDFRVLKENVKYAQKVAPAVEKEIKEENLLMQIVRVTYTYDRQKLFIYYTAEDRVDFRKFIRVLGSKLKVRIQMVQIGVRDKASIIGGIGICGLELCCHRFLRNIESVNIDMARNQQMSLNPENISGCCGRLLCCLRYENDFYEEARKSLPETGQKVITPSGKGEVFAVNYITGIITVKLKSGALNEFKLNDLKGSVKDKLKKWIK